MSGNPPRAVSRSEGHLVKVQLGFHADSYLLILDHDDGNTQWQTQQWEDIPSEVSKQLDNCDAKGRNARIASFGLDEEWFVEGARPDGTGVYSWWAGFSDNESIRGIDAEIVAFGANDSWVIVSGGSWVLTNGISDALFRTLDHCNSTGKRIENVCLSLCHPGGYFIKFRNGTGEWCDLGQQLSSELKSRKNGSDPVLHVCEGAEGGWLIIRERSFTASNGVSEDLTGYLAEFYSAQRQRREKADNRVMAFRCESKRKHDEEEAQSQRAEEAARISHVASEAYLAQARNFARKHGYSQICFNAPSRVVSFSAAIRFSDREDLLEGRIRINVYYTTRTVGTCLYHPPTQRSTQLFRRLVSPDLLDEIFRCARDHDCMMLLALFKWF
jgi:hypothetical protein